MRASCRRQTRANCVLRNAARAKPSIHPKSRLVVSPLASRSSNQRRGPSASVSATLLSSSGRSASVRGEAAARPREVGSAPASGLPSRIAEARWSTASAARTSGFHAAGGSAGGLSGGLGSPFGRGYSSKPSKAEATSAPAGKVAWKLSSITAALSSSTGHCARRASVAQREHSTSTSVPSESFGSGALPCCSSATSAANSVTSSVPPPSASYRVRTARVSP
mmetsp:Transcript_4732/g.14128  ORF Transcript_4732/g.14128 Transcript_4732/m.14128 type:complete len:222 (-) Transcript_4732:196-861(-)